MPPPTDSEMRKGRGPQPLTRHLATTSGRLGRILGRCRRLQKLNRLLVALLPPHLQTHVRLASVGPRYWVVEADGPAWGTRVRFQMKTLHQQLCNQLGEPVPALRLRIVPASEPPPPPVRTVVLSARSAQVIASAARGIDDPALKAALERLARRGST